MAAVKEDKIMEHRAIILRALKPFTLEVNSLRVDPSVLSEIQSHAREHFLIPRQGEFRQKILDKLRQFSGETLDNLKNGSCTSEEREKKFTYMIERISFETFLADLQNELNETLKRALSIRSSSSMSINELIEDFCKKSGRENLAPSIQNKIFNYSEIRVDSNNISDTVCFLMSPEANENSDAFFKKICSEIQNEKLSFDLEKKLNDKNSIHPRKAVL